MHKKKTFRIWYPGSAYASREWIIYLKNQYKGPFLFTDLNSFQWNQEIINKSDEIVDDLDTFSREHRKRIIGYEFDTLILSLHPGLKVAEDLIKSDILKEFNPSKLLYSTTGLYNGISQEQETRDILATLGYHQERIILIPDLNRVYSEYSL